MERTHEARILSNLLKHGHRLECTPFVEGFPQRSRRDIQAAIKRLARLGFVKSRVLGGREYIVLRPDRVQDAMRWASASSSGDPLYVPEEEVIPRDYAQPFHVARGEHMVNGAVSRYAFCHHNRNRYDVTCFVINAKNSATAIRLGNLDDPNSLIARFLAEIDQHFGTRRFTKEEIKRSFPRELVGNNQPTKAAIEYLCYNDYLLRSDYLKRPSMFERTWKKRPVMSLDKAVARRDVDYRKQTIMYSFYQ